MRKVMCIQCGEAEVVKRGLCNPCYGRVYRQAGAPSRYSEIEFVKNYFTHTNWLAQPARFRLSPLGVKLKTYTPDFYDGETGVFIEVSSNRDAYFLQKASYDAFRGLYPTLKLEVRSVTGELCEGEFLDDPESQEKKRLTKIEQKRQLAEAREYGKRHGG
jgi:hypothetical protein